jgi:hypothetical protein
LREPLPAPVPEIRHSDMPNRAARLRGFERAAEYVGQARLGALIGIAERTVRAKCDGSRGLSDADLASAASAVERVASEMFAHARRLRDLSGGSNGALRPRR